MNLHITPSLNIDRLCKTVSVLLFLVRVFAWRLFAPPHESSRHSMRCIFVYCSSYLCLAGRKVDMRKPAKITIWRVFAWRPFACSPLFVVSLHGGAKGRHAKTRQIVILADFCLATFRPARQIYDKQGRKREKSPHENPPNDGFFVFSHADLSPRHTKVRDIRCVAFLSTFCRSFAWRGERSPC